MERIDWEGWDDAAVIPEDERNEWAAKLLEDKEPGVYFAQSGDSMVIVTRDDDGTVEVYDTRVLRVGLIRDFVGN